MASKPPEEVALVDLATKDDLKDLVTRQEFNEETGVISQDFASGVAMIMGEIRKIAARQEEHGRMLDRLVAASDGVAR